MGDTNYRNGPQRTATDRNGDRNGPQRTATESKKAKQWKLLKFITVLTTIWLFSIVDIPAYVKYKLKTLFLTIFLFPIILFLI